MTIACGLLLGSALWQQCATQSNTAEETARLLQTDREFSRYSQQYNPAEAFHRYLDEQALQLPNLSEPILGRDAIYNGIVGGGYLLIWEPGGRLGSRIGGSRLHLGPILDACRRRYWRHSFTPWQISECLAQATGWVLEGVSGYG